MSIKARLARLERIEAQRRLQAATGPALSFASGRLCVAPWAQLDMAELKKSEAAYDAACKDRP